ncbi:MAG: 50S ribosomal protein L9 [Phycisphaerae bacterium]
MKVLLNQNVSKLGEIGEVVDVKPGFARNYLLPQGLATAPTEANIRKVEQRKQEYLAELARRREEIEARARVLEGKQLTISARANEEGHLYGSVGGAQIAAVLAEEGIFIEPENVDLPEPIRQLDKYDVTIRFPQEITATVHVWVVPIGGPQPEEGQEAAEESSEDQQAPAPEESEESDSEES